MKAFWETQVNSDIIIFQLYDNAEYENNPFFTFETNISKIEKSQIEKFLNDFSKSNTKKLKFNLRTEDTRIKVYKQEIEISVSGIFATSALYVDLNESSFDAFKKLFKVFSKLKSNQK